MKKFWLVTLLIIATMACTKDSYNPIPNVSFRGTINLDLPQYNYSSFTILRATTGQTFGNNGVVVYWIPNTDAYAYDLMCPHEHEAPGYFYTKLEKKGDDEVVCPQCGTHYNLLANGAPTEGPSQYPLRQYTTYLNGSSLTISNGY
nr:Rieske 2Fe-2S domain-containing protein [uncultured Carboxylicivirga sp.]